MGRRYVVETGDDDSCIIVWTGLGIFCLGELDDETKEKLRHLNVFGIHAAEEYVPVEDVWHAAYRIAAAEERGGLCRSEMFGLFGTDRLSDIFSMDPVSVTAKVMEHDTSGFRPGDEVKTLPEGGAAVILKDEGDGDYTLLFPDGKTRGLSRKHIIKTGKRFPEITEILEGIGKAD